MTKTTWILGMTLFLVLAGVFVFSVRVSDYNDHNIQATTTPSQNSIKKIPYGKVSLSVGEVARFDTISVKLLRVTDDSRCPQDVQCIWAGTIKVEIESVSGMGTSTSILEIGKTLTTEAEAITFISATPYPKAGTTILPTEYAAVFDVSLRTKAPLTQGACYVGGCSSEVCSDRPDVASNCMYKSEFACYKKTSTCERQVSGACGWTQTEALKICINASTEVQ